MQHIAESLVRVTLFAVVGAACLVLVPASSAIVITIDYRYDSNRFFDTNPATTSNPDGATGAVQARAALDAVATRFSSIITTSLDAVAIYDDGIDGRIGFHHPGTGDSFQVSAASRADKDILVVASGQAPADEYRNGIEMDANELVIYAGARSLSVGGIGGTGTGINYTTVFDDPHSHLNRGFNVGDSLPVWGGSVSFDNDGSTTWHFDHTTAAPLGKYDLYSTALHEVGHVLGLNTGWNDFAQHISGASFTGANAVAALNEDNGTSVSAVPLESTSNPHWNDNYDGGSYQSYIFMGADPNLAGTVGSGTLQDLLMEPTAHYGYYSPRRFELTNIDVAALEDIGWTVIDYVPQIPGDANGDLHVNQADALAMSNNWGLPGGWSQGDFNGDGTVDMKDASIMAANWGDHTEGAGANAVPEPSGLALLVLGVLAVVPRRRRA